MNGRVAISTARNAWHQLTLSEEETLIRYILDLDTRGFPPQICGVEDMANSLLVTRRKKPVSKL